MLKEVLQKGPLTMESISFLLEVYIKNLVKQNVFLKKDCTKNIKKI